MRKNSDEKQDHQRSKNDKPLSLYPLTMDEALRKALETPPPKDDEKKRKKADKK